MFIISHCKKACKSYFLLQSNHKYILILNYKNRLNIDLAIKQSV